MSQILMTFVVGLAGSTATADRIHFPTRTVTSTLEPPCPLRKRNSDRLTIHLFLSLSPSSMRGLNALRIHLVPLSSARLVPFLLAIWSALYSFWRCLNRTFPSFFLDPILENLQQIIGLIPLVSSFGTKSEPLNRPCRRYGLRLRPLYGNHDFASKFSFPECKSCWPVFIFNDTDSTGGVARMASLGSSNVVIVNPESFAKKRALLMHGGAESLQVPPSRCISSPHRFRNIPNIII